MTEEDSRRARIIKATSKKKESKKITVPIEEAGERMAPAKEREITDKGLEELLHKIRGEILSIKTGLDIIEKRINRAEKTLEESRKELKGAREAFKEAKEILDWVYNQVASDGK